MPRNDRCQGKSGEKYGRNEIREQAWKEWTTRKTQRRVGKTGHTGQGRGNEQSDRQGEGGRGQERQGKGSWEGKW